MTFASRRPLAFFRQLTFAQGLLLTLSLAPLFVVTVRSWSSALLILGALLCAVALMRPSPPVAPLTGRAQTLQRLVLLTLALPVLAIAISSVLRANHVWAAYDAPARFLIAIPIFLLALRARANTAAALQYIAPLSLVLTLLHQLFVPQPHIWGPERMSTYFADPLVFGYLALTFGLISATSIHLLQKDKPAVVLFKLAGLGIGLYLSIQSNSRTGWLALPLVLGLWLTQYSAGRAASRTLWGAGLLVAACAAVAVLSPTVSQRVALAAHEITSYSWVGMAPETSVGYRITFLRIAADLFSAHPLLGYGDASQPLGQIPSHIGSYATPETLRFALSSGFHNEVVTNAIRSGLAGLVASVLLFFVPIGLFSTRLRAASIAQRAHARLGWVLMVCVLISSLSTEVFDLKYTASFFALMIALLAAGTLAPDREADRASPD